MNQFRRTRKDSRRPFIGFRDMFQKSAQRAKLHASAMAVLLAAPLIFSNTSSASDQASENNSLPKCLYVSSYHKGYDWSDGVEEGIRSVLDGQCQLRQFDMDTKRRKSTQEKQQAADLAFELIQAWKPDIVITSDDNAAKYLIVPKHDKVDIPFVFSGVNWTVEEYGFPFQNVTGIVEVAPIEPMLTKAIELSGGLSAVYLGADTLTEGKNFQRIKSGAEKLGIKLEKVLVADFEAWAVAFTKAQYLDFIVMGSNSGIENWNEEQAESYAIENSQKLSVTNHAWMMSVTGLGFTKIPQEHGQWAAEAGLAILSGTSPSSIPVATNRKWELWMNNALVDKAEVVVPTTFSRRAKRLASVE